MNDMSPSQRTSDREVAAPSVAAMASSRDGQRDRSLRRYAVAFTLLAATVGGYVAWQHFEARPERSPKAMPLPEVTVATPLQDTVAPTTSFLGQFSAVESVELRAQVGGTLTRIGFHDGQIVHAGDLLFVIDPRPFEIRFEQARAQLRMALARKALVDVELWRAQQLRQSSFATAETVDQRAADQRSAEASVDEAQATIHDAQLDLEFSRITAPFEGRIGAHQVSVGSLVSGSRAGTGASTLLGTVVSLNPIYLDFEMSEADFLAFQSARHDIVAGEPVAISLGGDGPFKLHGTLDFIDNVVDRSSGTIHARATVANPDLSLTPGQFARVRLALGKPAPVLLVPAAAVIPDQSREIVMVVGADGKVIPKPVVAGDVYRGLRIINSGIAATDHVVINGLVRTRPGAAVKAVPGTITLANDDE